MARIAVFRVLPLVIAGLTAACGNSVLRPHTPAVASGGPTAPVKPVDLVRSTAATNCGIPKLKEAVLQEVNALRASGQVCGRQSMAPAPPLVWNDVLFSAAARHSRDMAQRNYFDHVTPEGTRIAQRASAEGYNWRSVAENIAGGDTDVDSVVSGWRASSGHCSAMLDPKYTEVGVACVQRSGTKWGTYWTMVLGKRR
jgi:uncharacterized protein YkwD